MTGFCIFLAEQMGSTVTDGGPNDGVLEGTTRIASFKKASTEACFQDAQTTSYIVYKNSSTRICEK